VSFATITLCVASQRVFVVVYFVIDSVRKLLDTHAYCFPVDDTCTCTRPVLQMLPLISTLYDSHQRLSSFLVPPTTTPPPHSPANKWVVELSQRQCRAIGR